MKKLIAASLSMAALVLITANSVFAAASVTTATGGAGISADKARIGGTGSLTTLTGPALTETDSTGMPLGSMILNAPSGFEFDTTTNSVTVAVTGIGVGTDIEINASNTTTGQGTSKTVTATASNITIWVTATSINSARSTCTWSGIKVRPINGTPLVSSNITYSGTSSGISSGTNMGTLSEIAGAGKKLAYTTAPAATNTAGVMMASTVVQMQDQFGNTVSSNGVPVTVALNAGAFASGTITVNTGSGGAATFSNLVVNAAGSYTLTASATGFTATPAAAFIVVPASANSLSFQQGPPSSIGAGATFTPAVMVKVTDQFANVISNKAVAITLAGGGAISGTSTQTTTGTGLATFNNLSVSLVGTGKTLIASVTSPSLAATSTAFTVTAGTANKLVMKTEPSATATAGMAFVTQPAVYIEDSFGNVVTTDGSTVSAALATGNGPLQGTLTATAVNGVATFANLMDNKAESLTLQFTDGILAAVTSATTIVVSPGAIDHYAVTAPSPQDVGVPFTATVTALDSFGNAVNDNSTVVTMSGSTANVQFDSNGDGTFGDNTRTLSNGALTVRTKDGVAETITITATGASKTGTSASIVVNPISSDWKYRKTITINHTKIPNTDQANFPVLVNVADTNLAAHARSDGHDILFTASDGATILSYEREKYTNITGALAAWVKIPTLSHTTDTVVYMYYGNTNSADHQDAQNVWDANFKLVYHLSDAGPTNLDSTANGNLGTQSGGVTFGTTGQVASATTYSNGNTTPNEFISARSQPLGSSYSGSFTYRLWIKVSSFTGGSGITDANNMSYFLDRTTAVSPLVDLVAVGSGFGYQTRYDDGTGLGGPAGGIITNGSWAHVEMVRDYNTAFRLYINGTQVSTTTDSGSKSLTPPVPKLGRHATFGTPAYLNGSIDEFRISSVARSADWIQTEYNNESSPSTFCTLGTEQADTVIAVNSSTNASVYGQSVTFTATVTGTGTPTGSVQFQTNSVNFGSAVALSAGSANSSAISTLAAGNTTITAIYIPTGNFNPNTGTLAGGQIVNAAPLSITASNDTKVYGQTGTYGAGSTAFASSGLKNGETIGSVTITASGGTAANAAVNIYALTASAATGGTFKTNNYSIAYNSGTLTVTPLAVTLTGNRAYDATTTAAAGILTVANAIGGDDVSVASGAGILASANVGSQAITSLGTLVLGGTTAGNYTLTGAGGSVQIITAPLTITAASNTKTYDGNTTAASVPGVSGLQGSDSVTGLTEAYTDKNAGAGKTLTVTGYVVNDGNGGNNYSVSTPNNTSGVINQRSLAVSAIGASKVYDGNTTAAVTLSDNRIGGDSLNDNYTTALFSDKNVGIAKSISVSGITISGMDVGNYSANTTASASADITTASVTGSITASDKVYDGTPVATISGYSLSGAIGGDVVSLTGGAANFFDKNVGQNKSVVASGLTLSGGDAGNYALASSSANTTASIAAASLTVSADNQSRPYGQPNPTLTVGYSGFVGSDDTNLLSGMPDLSTTAVTNSLPGGYPIMVSTGSLSAVNYTFAFINGTLTVGNPLLTITADDQSRPYGATNPVLTVTYSGFINGDDTNVLSGVPLVTTTADTNSTVAAGPYIIAVTNGTLVATNYDFAFVSGSLTVTPAVVTVTADNQTMVYGTAVPVLTASYTGFVNGEDTNVLSGTPDLSTSATATSPVVTSPYAIIVTNGTLAADNYTFAFVDGTLTVTPAPVTGSITASDKTYDGSATATINGYSLSGAVGGDDVSLSGGSASFNDKNVGISKPVTATGLSLTGTNASNYSLLSGSASTTASINALALLVSATGVDKTYDGTTLATVTLADNRISGDSLSDGYTTAIFGDKNVGIAKSVSVSGITIGGTDAGNYTANTAASASATITAAQLTGSITASDKVYDGTTAATIASYGLSGTIGSDDVSLGGGSASFLDKNTGNGKSVTASGLTLGGSDAGNYSLASNSAATTANITAAPLGIFADNKSKTIGVSNPPLTATYVGFVSGEDTNALTTAVSVSTTATDSSSVGTYSITASGGVAPNYEITYTDGTMTVNAVPQLNIVKSGTQVVVTCPATISTQIYQIGYKDNLSDATWTLLGSPTPGTGGSISVTNQIATTKRFFQVNIAPGQ